MMRRAQDLPAFLLVPILAQALFALVGGNFMSFALASAGHIYLCLMAVRQKARPSKYAFQGRSATGRPCLSSLRILKNPYICADVRHVTLA